MNVLADMWFDFIAFFTSMYNPNRSIIENIFYCNLVWFVIWVFLVLKIGKGGIFYVTGILFLAWLFGLIVLTALGEMFLLLLPVAFIVTCIFYARKAGSTHTQS